jgi:hypothetical protein
VAAYTALQLLEVVVAASILLFGVLDRSPSLIVLGGGFLIAKAVINILAVEGGSIYRRSLVGYGLGGAFVVVALVVVHFSSATGS